MSNTTGILLEAKKNIFFQLDTNSIIASYFLGQGNANVLANTVVCDQGSMSLGSSIDYFTVNVDPDQEVCLTILPLQLFSLHKVYFTGINPASSPYFTYGQFVKEVSFKITMSNKLPADGTKIDFSLNAVIEVPNMEPINITIDPKLRVQS
jgi:hypothetical protein